MNTPTPTSKPYGQATSSIGEQVSSAADSPARSLQQGIDSAARSAQHGIDSATDALSSKVENLRSQAEPLLNRVSAQAEAAARRGIDAVKDGSQQLREKALRASDSTVAYVKDEPVKAMLIAAATGAVLMGIISLMGRSRND